MTDIVLAGWLMKKRNEDSKGKMLANKYQKRWFELTEDSLAYAQDPNELKETKIRVFSLLELKWFKRVGDLKLELQFPERMLCVKAPSPGEADKWYQTVERLQLERAVTLPPRTASEFMVVPPEIKKPQIATAFTIEADSDSDEDTGPGPTRIHSHRRSERTTPPRQQAGGKAWGTPDKRPGPLPIPAQLTPTLPMDSDGSNQSNRPPSPRALLANPRLGGMIVSTPTKRQASEPYSEGQEVEAFDTESVDSPVAPSRPGGAAAPAPLDTEQEPSRPAYLNTSLRPKVLIQDEVAGALRNASSVDSNGTQSPLNSPMHQLYPVTSGGSRANTPPSARARRPPIIPPKDDVVTLDDRPSPSTAQPSRLASAHGGFSATTSRPASAASAAPPRRPMRTSGPEDERIELTPSAPPITHRTSGQSRLSSANSMQHTTPTAAPPQRGCSAASSAHVGTPRSEAANTETESAWVEEDWDSSDDDDGCASDKPSPPVTALTNKKGAGGGIRPGASATVTASPRQLELKQPHGSHNSWDDSDSPTGRHRAHATPKQPCSNLKHGRTGHLNSAGVELEDVRARQSVEADEEEEEVGQVPQDADRNWVEEDWDADD